MPEEIKKRLFRGISTKLLRYFEMTTLRAVFLFMVLSVCAWSQIPIERLTSSAFPWEMVASPKVERLAWVVSQRGPWNVWVAEGPSYQGRRLTQYSEDDGQEITNVAVSADGKWVVFVRGGPGNRKGETPNPTSDPAGADQSVWSVPFDGGPPVKLGVGANAVVAPGSDRVAWTKGGNVWIAPVSGGKAEQLFRARGDAESLTFSPSGQQIAFASTRGDHAFIGVYDLAAKSLRWMDPSTDQDQGPVWSPDGKSLAFVRVPSEKPQLPFGARREAQPWSIRVADATTGSSRQVFIAEAGKGSVFREIEFGPTVVWTSADEILFPWERTGWKLLYGVSAKGGTARLLTPGTFEIETIAPLADQSGVLISSNQGDLERRTSGASPRRRARRSLSPKAMALSGSLCPSARKARSPTLVRTPGGLGAQWSKPKAALRAISRRNWFLPTSPQRIW